MRFLLFVYIVTFFITIYSNKNEKTENPTIDYAINFLKKFTKEGIKQLSKFSKIDEVGSEYKIFESIINKLKNEPNVIKKIRKIKFLQSRQWKNFLVNPLNF
ncbi:Hypothetical protein SRAE_X000140400 [Strongyloides ratti]|uniref:Uncharacterized protein n=1 Tax=Strongyloides ratti TaxID=34506 RepID=A0A090KQ58_STRRB|nr:Hypothetical protein SRAE_X000140400 [Strongyloides ratti]CEF59658.1 Hypothetical protein SRAE_X000140400 [Strongyloides ratti]